MRFISARAGNTLTVNRSDRPSAVYPRWRGEHIFLPDTLMYTDGLSPLARGTHFPQHAKRSKRRFIPARAGNTLWNAYTARTVSVYPRSRGEHSLERLQRQDRVGLSPLARGTRTVSPMGFPSCRFIPARAGNTSGIPVQRCGKPVYPRSRGEH